MSFVINASTCSHCGRMVQDCRCRSAARNAVRNNFVTNPASDRKNFLPLPVMDYEEDTGLPPRQVQCSTCDGTGKVGGGLGAVDGLVSCEVCHGSGVIAEARTANVLHGDCSCGLLPLPNTMAAILDENRREQAVAGKVPRPSAADDSADYLPLPRMTY